MSMTELKNYQLQMNKDTDSDGSKSPNIQVSFETAKQSDASQNLERNHLKNHDQQASQREIEADQMEGDRRVWTVEEEEVLIDLHNLWGNKWTDISLKLCGKDHNSTKNHFYAQIRKSIRRINFFISLHLRKQYKPLNITHISKMVTSLSQRVCPDATIKEIFEKHEQEVYEMKKGFFEFAKKEECSSLSIFQMKKLCDLLDQINFFLAQTKKPNSAGKKPKGRPSNAIKKAEQLQRLQKMSESSKCSESSNNVQNSYFFMYCQQMMNQIPIQIFCGPEQKTMVPNRFSFTPYVIEFPNNS